MISVQKVKTAAKVNVRKKGCQKMRSPKKPHVIVECKRMCCSWSYRIGIKQGHVQHLEHWTKMLGQ